MSLHVIREMERKRGGDGERKQTSRSTTITIQQQDRKDKRKTGWREMRGGGEEGGDDEVEGER